jgi:hypothetical protein
LKPALELIDRMYRDLEAAKEKENKMEEEYKEMMSEGNEQLAM